MGAGGYIELPSQDDLRRLLDYAPETGVLVWKTRGDSTFDRLWAGKRAFNSSWNGYRVGTLFRRRSIGAHRVAFKYVYGFDPPEVDHINGNRADNRISNLRAVTPTENRRNAARPSHNTSGIVGVSYDKARGKWKAFIHVRNQIVNIGRYADKSDAIAARKAAEREYGFHPNHGRPLCPER